MNKQKIIKTFETGACVAATVALLMGDAPDVKAVNSGVGVGTGLAGISVYLDRYYDMNPSAVTENEVNISDNTSDNQTTKGTAEEESKARKAPVSEYENVGVSIASNYVNIRTQPSTDGEIVGKLYKGCAATILEHVDDWVRITSGNAEGYIKSEYLAIGFDAEELIEKYATRWAVVNTETLRVRMEPSTEAKIATLVPRDERLQVDSILDDWVEISLDDGDITGFVSADYVKIEVEFEHAITIEEEQAEIRRQKEAEEALRKQQEEKRRKEQQRQEEAAKKENQSSGSSSQSSSASESSGTASDLAKSIVSFAKKFVGNPYVYGGTSLTKGADCSGFVQSVFDSFGISLPRDSRSQCASAGKKVSLSSVRQGDLIFYTNSRGVVNHVAIYIGDGKVVHASSPSSGIKISNMKYRTPYMARRVVD